MQWHTRLLLLLCLLGLATLPPLAHAGPVRARSARSRRGRIAHTVSPIVHKFVAQPVTEAPRASSVAIVNAVGYHIEVYCALLWSLQQAGSNVTLYVDPKSYDIQSVIGSWYDKPFLNWTQIVPDACQYEAIAFSTWPEQHTVLMASVLYQRCPGQKYILLVHNPDFLLQPPPDEKVLPMSLLTTSNSHLLALAPHTVSLVAEKLAAAGIQRSVDLFLPVFPIDLSCTQREKQDSPDNCASIAHPQRRGFVLQGLFQAQRRKYSQLFEEILANPDLMHANSSFSLTLIGQGQVELPPPLASKVIKLSSLDYREYYRTIRASLAVVPAFASDVYYTKKASSSVAAAMVCGTPLLADRELLAHYPYLSKDAVYLREHHQGDGGLMQHVMRMPASESAARVSELSVLQDAAYAKNLAVMVKILRAPHLAVQ